ncbi:MAG: biotin/lipoate A/B protein ligase family protein [Thioalkalivibrionaceae bacterium]
MDPQTGALIDAGVSAALNSSTRQASATGGALASGALAGVVRWIDGGTVEAENLHALYAGAAACASLDETLVLWLRTEQAHISVGAHQNAGLDLDLEGCRKRGLPVVRRVLGGGAVWVDADQDCFFIVQPRSALARGHRHLFALGLGIAVRALGQLAEEVRCPATDESPERINAAGRSTDLKPDLGEPMGLRIEGQDVWLGERKVMGSGAATVGDGCVFGASLLGRFPAVRFVEALRERSPGFRAWLIPSVARRVGGLMDAWPTVDFKSLRYVVRRECERRFTGRLVDSVLDRQTAARWLAEGREALADLAPVVPSDHGPENSVSGSVTQIPDGLRIHREAFAFDTATRFGRLRVELERGCVVRLGAGPDWCAEIEPETLIQHLSGVRADRIALERALTGNAPAIVASEVACRIDGLARAIRSL